MSNVSTLCRDVVIKFRAERELKARLESVALSKRKRVSEFLREQMWLAVEAGEKAQSELPLGEHRGGGR